MHGILPRIYEHEEAGPAPGAIDPRLAHHHPIPEGVYRAMQQCAANGGLLDEEDPERGCFALERIGADGFRGTAADGTTFAKEKGYQVILRLNECLAKEGFLDDGDTVTCYKTGHVGGDDFGNAPEFGYFDNKVITLSDSLTPNAADKAEAKDEGTKLSTIFLTAGAAVFGVGLAFWALSDKPETAADGPRLRSRRPEHMAQLRAHAARKGHKLFDRPRRAASDGARPEHRRRGALGLGAAGLVRPPVRGGHQPERARRAALGPVHHPI